MRDKVLGVIGGMGPLATDVFYKYVIENTRAECDQAPYRHGYIKQRIYD